MSGQKKTINYQALLDSINNRRSKIAVMGLGYVGLPLAVEFARAKYCVTGVDPDERKIESIYKFKSYLTDLTDEDLKSIVAKGFLKATSDFSALAKMDVVFICVPTPFSRNKEPDVSYIIKSAEKILEHINKPQLIVLESTTYPGTTDEILIPILQSKGLKAGKDFFVVFSPERVDPGNKTFRIQNTPKVIGGIDPESTELAKSLYSKVIAEHLVVTVSSAKIAEMTKLLENIFRSVNIALINELTLLCDRMKIDIWEVIDAAASKPFGYMPFYPGGVGGHCIPVDPYYLSWKAREFDFYTKFIELAAELNLSMPKYVVNKIGDILNESGKSIKSSKILAIGAAFKANINDARNSPSIKVIEELLLKGALVDYHDPHIACIGNGAGSEYFGSESKIGHMESVKLTAKSVASYDCVVILSPHDAIDLNLIAKHSKIIMDTKNVCKGLALGKGCKLVKL